MTFQPLAIADMMKFGGRGSDNLNSTVYLSRALISLTVLKRMLRGMLIPCGGLAIRSKVALTSLAISQLCARSGMMVLPLSRGSRRIRLSNMQPCEPRLLIVPD